METNKATIASAVEYAMRPIANLMKRIADDVEAIRSGEPTSEADLHASAETCGRSASEPEAAEKARRVYCQDIVYQVCSVIDAWRWNRIGGGVVSGTVGSPSTEVQDAVKEMLAEIRRLSRGCCDPAATIAPEPTMPAIEAGLWARAHKRWPLLRLVRCDAFKLPFRLEEHKEFLGGFETWDKLIEHLESKCPAPSEPEATEYISTWECTVCGIASCTMRGRGFLEPSRCPRKSRLTRWTRTEPNEPEETEETEPTIQARARDLVKRWGKVEWSEVIDLMREIAGDEP